MDKKYQVFISSTYTDLKEERSRVFQTLMELDCIPAGMELFPATDEEQFEFIKKIIDDCDYYLLIIGGRYGSTTTQGISYTEKEYDYALEKGLKIIALLHENPSEIPYEKSEQNKTSRKLLESFRAKAATGRLVRFWKKADELPGIVALSMAKTIKMFPAKGWIRADLAESKDSSRELARLSTENHELREEIQNLRKSRSETAAHEETLSILNNAEREVSIFYKDSKNWEIQNESTTLLYVFSLITPEMTQEQTTRTITEILAVALKDSPDRAHRPQHPLPLNEVAEWLADLSALDLIEPSTQKHPKSDKNDYWQLTDKAKSLYKQMRLNKLKTQGNAD